MLPPCLLVCQEPRQCWRPPACVPEGSGGRARAWTGVYISPVTSMMCGVRQPESARVQSGACVVSGQWCHANLSCMNKENERIDCPSRSAQIQILRFLPCWTSWSCGCGCRPADRKQGVGWRVASSRVALEKAGCFLQGQSDLADTLPLHSQYSDSSACSSAFSSSDEAAYMFDIWYGSAATSYSS